MIFITFWFNLISSTASTLLSVFCPFHWTFIPRISIILFYQTNFLFCFLLSFAELFIDISNCYRWFDDVSEKMSPFGIYSIIMWPSIRKSRASFMMARNGHSVKWMNFPIALPIYSNSMDTRRATWSVYLWKIDRNSWPHGWAYRKSVLLFHWLTQINDKHR